MKRGAQTGAHLHSFTHVHTRALTNAHATHTHSTRTRKHKHSLCCSPASSTVWRHFQPLTRGAGRAGRTGRGTRKLPRRGGQLLLLLEGPSSCMSQGRRRGQLLVALRWGRRRGRKLLLRRLLRLQGGGGWGGQLLLLLLLLLLLRNLGEDGRGGLVVRPVPSPRLARVLVCAGGGRGLLPRMSHLFRHAQQLLLRHRHVRQVEWVEHVVRRQTSVSHTCSLWTAAAHMHTGSQEGCCPPSTSIAGTRAERARHVCMTWGTTQHAGAPQCMASTGRRF